MITCKKNNSVGDTSPYAELNLLAANSKIRLTGPITEIHKKMNGASDLVTRKVQNCCIIISNRPIIYGQNLQVFSFTVRDNFFVNIVPSLKISPKENYETDVKNDNELILNYINKFENHPSIKVIKSRKKEEQTFTFDSVSYEEVISEIRKLQAGKTIKQNDIPTKILKENSDVFAIYFHKNINFCIENSIFPSD